MVALPAFGVALWLRGLCEQPSHRILPRVPEKLRHGRIWREPTAEPDIGGRGT
jgi:hypothetical protein